ncbi:hypothetical protein SprV_0100169200 [Sparganum proliferum]
MEPDRHLYIDAFLCGHLAYVLFVLSSQTLTKPERNYSTTHKELLAVVTFVKKFHHYLAGKRFILRTDHQTLRWLENFKDPTGQLARWQADLLEYSYTVIHRASKSIRMPMPYLAEHKRHHRPQHTPQQLRLRLALPTTHAWNSLRLCDGVLFLQYSPTDPRRLVLPHDAIHPTLSRLHADLGHAGQARTDTAARQRFWCPNQRRIIQDICNTCPVCAEVNNPNPTQRAPLQPIQAGYPNEIVGVDLMGPMPPSPRGNRHILVLVDFFTKWREAVPLPQADAITVAKATLSEWICRHGVPERLHSDQGAQFESRLMGELCELLHIRKSRSTPWHPQGNGQVERTNRTLRGLIQSFVNGCPGSSWDVALPQCLLAYRSATHSSTGHTPFALMYGREVRLPLDTSCPLPLPFPEPPHEFVRNLRANLYRTHELARTYLSTAHQRQKEYYGRRAHGAPYQPGDKVFWFQDRLSLGSADKFSTHWIGPFVVVEVPSEALCILRASDDPEGPTFAAHFNELKPYALDDNSCGPVSSELPSFPSAELPHPPTDPPSIVSVPSSPPSPAVPTSPPLPSPLPPLVSRTVEVPPEENTRQPPSKALQDDDHESSVEPGVEAEKVSFVSSQSPDLPSASPPPVSGQTYQTVLIPDRFGQKNYWMPDGHCKTCFECNAKFGIFRRRHHCRFCGRIFCFQCSNHLLDGLSIGQPGPQRACVFCATSRALSSESRSFEIPNRSFSSNFSPELNLDNPSRASSPLQSTKGALTNFTGPRLFPVDPVNDPLLPQSSRSQPLGEKYQSAHQLTFNIPGGERCKREIELGRPSASQWHLSGRLASTSTATANVIAVRTWHPVRPQQRADITKLFPNQEEGNTSNNLHFNPLQRPDLGSMSGSSSRLHQKQLQPQQSTTRPNTSIDLQTFLTLWLKMSGCSSAQDLGTPTLTNPVAYMAEQPPPPSSPAGSFLSRLPLFFRLSQSSQVTGSATVTSKQEAEYARCLAPLPLRTVCVGSTRCAFGSDIVTWLLENSDGSLSSREEAIALCQAYTRASFLIPRPPAVTGTFEDNSTLFEIKEVGQFLSDIKPTSPGQSCPLQSIVLEETASATGVTPTSHVKGIVKMSPESQSHKNASSQTLAAQENELQTILHEHIMELVRQDVLDCQLSNEWVSTIYRLALMLSSQFELDLRPVVTKNLQNRKNALPGTTTHLPLIENPALFEFYQNKYTAMNILRYIQIKKVIRTADEPCEILGGVAFTGQAIHKFLPKELHQPRVLIIASSISYERNLFRMTSLESHSMQEEEYLINCVGKILAFRPTLLFVEGFVSNTALGMFIKAGLCLFCNIKRHVLERISRATGAPIVASIDTLLSGSFDCGPEATSPIGHCQWYKLITVPQPNGTMKPLTLLGTKPPRMLTDTVFGENSRVRWFCFRPDVNLPPEQTDRDFRLPTYSVILRGKDLASLKIVKRCLKFALLAFYNGQLELAFMRDAGILPSSIASSLRYQHTVQLSRDLEDCPSSMAFHMSKRVFTFSAFTPTCLPFLAGPSGRSAPLWDFYSYLVDWPAGRRLNDVLKQKALVVRARLYALRKRPSVHTLPTVKPGADTDGQLPAFCHLNLEPNLPPSLRLLRVRGGSGASELPLSECGDAVGAEAAPARDPTLASLSKRDAHAFSVARAAAFLRCGGGSNCRVSGVFKRTWSGVGQWVFQSRAGTSPSTDAHFQIVQPIQKSSNKRLRRSVRDARSYASLSLARSVFSTNSVLWPEPCIPTWIISIDFYGPNDLPLGLFLERFCFRSQTCLNRECDAPMLQHTQRFTQTSGSVELVLRHLDSVLPAADLKNDPNHTQIYMWTVCSACSTSSHAHLMSVASWHLSFIKFIDLLLNSTGVLTHISPNRPSVDELQSGPAVPSDQTASTHRPHECSARSLQHFFALGKNMATFSYTAVSTYEVVMPPVEILMFSPQSEPALAAAYARHIGATVKSSLTGGTLVDPIPPHTKLDTFRSLELPAYLRQEAYAVLKKFYQVTTLVKSHLFTLRHETMSDDRLTLVKTLENHLNWECGKSEIEIRVEILAHLTDTSTPRESAPPPEEARKPFLDLPIDPAVKTVSSLNTTDEAAFSPSGDLANENTVTASVSSSPISTATASCMTSLLTGARQSPSLSVNSNNSSDGCRNTDSQSCREENSIRHLDFDHTLRWKSRLDSLTLEEKIVLLLFLLNALRRWIFNFSQDWNTRLADYNSTVKHLEKSVREVRKRQQTTALPVGQSSTSIAFSLSANSNLTKKHQRQVVESETSQITPSSNTVQAPHTAPEGNKRELTTTTAPASAAAMTTTHADLATSILTGSNSSGSGNGASTTVSGVLRLLTSIRPGSEELKLCPDPWPASEHPQLAVPTLVSPIAQLAAAGSNPCAKGSVFRSSVELRAVGDDSCDDFPRVPLPPSPQPSPTSSSSADETTSRVFSSSYSATVPSHSELSQSVECPGGLPSFHAYHDSQSISLLVSELLKFPLLSSTPDVYVNDQELTSIIAYSLICDTYTHQLLSLLKQAEPDRSLRVFHRQSGVDTIEVGGKQAVSPFSSPRLRKIFRRITDSISDSNTQEDTGTHDADRHSQPLSVSRVTDYSQTRTSKKIGASTTKAPSVRIGTQNDLVSFQTDSSATDSSLCESHSDAPTAPTSIAPNSKTPASEKLPPALAPNPHIEIQYSDASTNFFVRVYYAAEFFNLRRVLFPQGENTFIWSLMRCRSWDARGGKSGSDFMKTRDERFVVKEVSAVEMRTFHEVHHQYFDHLMSAALENRLSVLARIVGLFHVGFKNSATGEARRMDVLVMENLFHNRPGITQIYDLKGSLRGRLITKSGSSLPRSLPVDIATTSNSCITAPTSDNHPAVTSSSSTGATKKTGPFVFGNGDVAVTSPPSTAPVLLDQNFINNSLESPIYLRLHSKNALMHCLNLDTLFLSELFIMDYSLLVGIDPSTGHMIVGIIDYLRKFTLNKRLEMLVKQTITSAQGPMPTIITPEDYRERLLDQMDRNFQLVPDQWYDSLVDHTESWRISVTTPPKFVP